jgi:hypothetical protein
MERPGKIQIRREVRSKENVSGFEFRVSSFRSVFLDNAKPETRNPQLRSLGRGLFLCETDDSVDHQGLFFTFDADLAN